MESDNIALKLKKCKAAIDIFERASPSARVTQQQIDVSLARARALVVIYEQRLVELKVKLD
jgi:hypothetical protein